LSVVVEEPWSETVAPVTAPPEGSTTVPVIEITVARRRVLKSIRAKDMSRFLNHR
jgi:hypothetical protein